MATKYSTAELLEIARLVKEDINERKSPNVKRSPKTKIKPIKPHEPLRIEHDIARSVNKAEVQVLTVEKYQWYSIEVAKMFAMHENRWLVDWIAEDGFANGYEPFVNRPIKTEQEEDKNIIYERPIVKPDRAASTIRWFIPWRHNIATPSFITYSALPFKHDGAVYRLIDIDYDEEGVGLERYNGGKEYGQFYDEICEHNLRAGKMNHTRVKELQLLLQRISKSIKSTLGPENLGAEPYYTGGGYRVLLKGTDASVMKEFIAKLIEDRMVCTSSTMGYQPQKLFSFQSLDPHFQTEVDPFSKYFKFSNPAFFFCRYTGNSILPGLMEYYKSFLSTTYNIYDKHLLYNAMRDNQVNLEAQLIPEILYYS